SMLKNAIPLPVLVEEAKRGGYDFIALADENLHGMLALFQETKKQQIKPVLGMKIKAVCDLMETGFLVYVKNQEGFQNLLTIQKQAIDKKMLSLEDLATHQSGLIFITSGSDAIIDQLVLNQDMNMAKHHVLTFKSIFESFYIGLSLDTFDSEMKIAPKIYELSEDTDVKMLPLHQTSYLSHDDKEVYEALIKIADEKNEVLDDANYAFQNQKDLKALFADYPFVFDTAKQVVSQIDFIYQPPHFEMPSYPLDEGIIESEYLRSLATIGLKKRLKKVKNPDIKIYQKRLIYELSVIHKMGYDTYFLIVFDFVRYAKMNGILVGPGRGSAAGSLVAYCLGITDVDSIAYDLLFERFLNPERMSMPDIDMDFPDNRRDEVIEYVKSRYGETHIVSITTFGTFALRSSIRDIARVMKIDNSRVAGIISRVIKNEIDTTDYEMVRLLKVAKAIEGLPRHTGTHPAGMILAKQNLTTTLPLQKGPFSFYQSQLEAKDLESMGLLKIDFLGIRNLTVIDEVIRFLGEDGIKISLLDIDLNDEKTYQLLSNADTSGVFQLESQGMRATLRKLKPNTFEDLVALLALYRPGPMDHIDEYIDRRNGKSFTYLHT
ncbi:MAG: DNA polymerase III subunit alpha, partial [Acholeplasmataceae bacterium]|nr:DNA polymerase III subunit alpha [Acholeplasmataceae bacterium]